jgi:hypothetical protein
MIAIEPETSSYFYSTCRSLSVLSLSIFGTLVRASTAEVIDPSSYSPKITSNCVTFDSEVRVITIKEG